MGLYFFQTICVVVIGLVVSLNYAEANKLLGSASANERNVNFIDDPSSVAIDFSKAQPGPDGVVCVQRKKYIDKTETNQLKECFVQNVTQCYYTYVTEYSEAETEKCVDFYWKTCKIIFEERFFNATTRMCKRPLIKRCDDNQFGSNSEPKIVCETFFETACNTTDVVPAPGDEPLPVTFCDKIPRKICAPDNCRVVEDTEQCEESKAQSTIEHPVELCDLQPQKLCSQEKVSVPRLVPEQKCRQVEKEICNTQLVNPHDVKKPVFIKYCTKKERLAALTTHSYLPPPAPQYKPADLPPPPIYSSPRTPPPPVYSSPSPPSSSYRTSFNGGRSKRDPNSKTDESHPIVWGPDSDNLTPQQPKAGTWVTTRSNSRIATAEGPESLSKRASRSLKFEDYKDHQPWNPVSSRRYR
jgi:hypothetical protein